MLDLSLYLAKKQCCGALNISFRLWLRGAINPEYGSGSSSIGRIYVKKFIDFTF
jgi:hypothetical protein